MRVAKTEKSSRYLEALKIEHKLMSTKLAHCKFTIKSLSMQDYLADPSDPTIRVAYPEPFQILEHADYGSLNDLVYYTKVMPESTIYAIFNELVQGLIEIHKAGVAHLDIKEKNILMTHHDGNSSNKLMGNCRIRPKYADFGVSREIKSG